MNHLSPLVVSPEEAGLKLVRFLERRLQDAPGTGQLHKWIRTGQVRVNKKRVQPFVVLASGDEVRLPPFAVPKSAGISSCLLGDDLPVVARTDDMLVLAKPAGLAVQGGSHITDSVVQRLASAFAGHAYIPAPVHRLDRHTSGLLVAATTHEAAKRLSVLFSTPGAVQKEYLAVVAGKTPFSTPHLLLDTLEKQLGPDGRERMACIGESLTMPLQNDEDAIAFIRRVAETQEALTRVEYISRFVCKTGPGEAPVQGTLLRIYLYTGKTHQIRVQLAHRGFPLIGDRRYAGIVAPLLFLHANHLAFLDGIQYKCCPPWDNVCSGLSD